jgi:thioredoxin-like negative regulator of GroEL
LARRGIRFDSGRSVCEAGAVKSLEQPGSRHLEAAQGWFDLGNHLEANEELKKITPELRAHPDVLEGRWRIYAKAQKWEACAHVAGVITRLPPDRARGWIMNSIALHRQGLFQQAWDTLVPVADRFPHVAAIAYDLACHGCRLGRLADAREWLARAFAGEDATRWKLMALDDPDLEPLWVGIRAG